MHVHVYNILALSMESKRRLAHGASVDTASMVADGPVALPLKKPLLIFLFLLFAPIAASAARYFWLGDGPGNWQTADRSSAGLLPPRRPHQDAMIRVFRGANRAALEDVARGDSQNEARAALHRVLDRQALHIRFAS